MSPTSPYIRTILSRLKLLREEAGISSSVIEERLILGPGWIERFEQGETMPSLDILIAILCIIGSDLSVLLAGIKDHPQTSDTERYIYALQDDDNLKVHFKYANFDAIYKLPKATTEQFENVMKTLRDSLSRLNDAFSDDATIKTIKTDSVAKAFLLALAIWPHANPSDLWWFIIYRAYCDPYNHPALYARLDFAQSWKRTGGWAFEEVIVRHYGPFLREHHIELIVATTASAEDRSICVGSISEKIRNQRLEMDKMDILLIGQKNGERHFFGVVHVKSSFAERRTDDVPMSKPLVKAGYISPLCTMDCKGSPSDNPFNKGELGTNRGKRNTKDRRSAKRKDIEDDKNFSACFSYNANTKPTPIEQKAKARIHVCSFQNPDDAFSKFLIASWETFLHA